MSKSLHFYFCMLCIVLCTSCAVSKFIPADRYLLNKVVIVSDNAELKPSAFYTYIRQNPNAKWFNLVKVPMHIYCASGQDSTKWNNRFFRKIGDKPVIYDPVIAYKSRKEIEKAVRNMGYMGAHVAIDTYTKGNKLDLVYRISSGRPYTIRSIDYAIDDDSIATYLQQDSLSTLLAVGDVFDINKLDAERQRITKLLQNKGYYRFHKDFLTYQADTMRNTYLVDVTLKLLPFQLRKEDEPQPHKQFLIRNINFFVGNEIPRISDEVLSTYDSINFKGNHIFYKDELFLRPKLLTDFNRIQKGDFYRERDVQYTYSNLGRLRILKYSNIHFKEVVDKDSVKLDAYISMARGKSKAVSFEIEGTNSAGDLGAAASVAFQHRNLFRGSEAFTVKLRGAYEAITGLGGQNYLNDDYTEYGIESSLNFPEFKFPFLSKEFRRKVRATSEVGLKFNSQVRPEFSRTLASASWSYKWADKQKVYHRFDLLDVNYVYMPHVSDEFRNYLDSMSNRNNTLLRTSYEDVFIVKTGYSYMYNSAGNSIMKTPMRNSYTLRFNIEEAGNLLYGLSKAFHRSPKDEKGYVLANIPFAKYVKADVDYARNMMIDSRNSLVFHVGLGVAYPYGNSKVLPFEKRYFSGGANSVRGWSVRSLGPGGFQNPNEEKLDFIKHTGDIKLDLNLEFRTHLFWKLNGAVFVDAGNIWTLRSDSEQKDGQFKFNKFYEQIAVAYGVGLRFDLDYLILRFDGGMKAINPMRRGRDKYPITRPNFNRDFAFHFAVGYPF